jgi:hypothetical protein
MKKKVFRERRNIETTININKGFKFEVDEPKEDKPKKDKVKKNDRNTNSKWA